MKSSQNSPSNPSSPNLIESIPLAFRMVFLSNPLLYFSISIFVFLTFWIIFNILAELLFFSPIVYFYIPSDAQIGFLITNISAGLLAIVISMNVYVIKNTKFKLDRSLFSGSMVGIASSACASCSSIGFLIISTFGGAGIVATGFLTNYEIPLRLLSIIIMGWALYVVINRITKSCLIDYSSIKNDKTNKS